MITRSQGEKLKKGDKSQDSGDSKKEKKKKKRKAAAFRLRLVSVDMFSRSFACFVVFSCLLSSAFTHRLRGVFPIRLADIDGSQLGGLGFAGA